MSTSDQKSYTGESNSVILTPAQGCLSSQEAAQRIASHARRTPVFLAKEDPFERPYDLWFKLDQMQVTGSFKIRGVLNALLGQQERAHQHGIVTASGGNHGLALAYAGNLLGVQATIFLPEKAPAEKRQAMRAYGASIIDGGKTMGEALDQAYLFAQKTHSLLIHPFADPLVIAGQGTIALEMLEDISHLDALVVAVGGGGMISGVSLVAKHLRPTLHIYGVEPVGCPTLYTSLKEGKITPVAVIQTRAGTLAVRETAPLNFGIVCQNVDRITLVSDDEMHQASEWLWAHYAIPTELSGAAAFAALLFNKIDFPPEVKTVGCILCGTGHEGLEGHV